MFEILFKIYYDHIYLLILKGKILATIGLLGFGFSLPVNSTIYTHNLNYTNTDNSGTSTLTGTVTFQDSDPNAQDIQIFGATFDTGFITDITFTYTTGGSSSTVSYSDFNPARGAEYFINHDGSVDFSASNLKSELTDLRFDTDIDAVANGGFFLTANTGTNFSVDVNNVDDFLLDTTSYHSPGPLPLFGLFTAFSSIKKLKSKYKKKYNF